MQYGTPISTCTVLAGFLCAQLGAGDLWAQEPDCVDDTAFPSDCFPDVLCPQFSNYLDFRRAVVHIYGPDLGGTGFLVNNVYCDSDSTDPDCGIPYLLTATHLVTGFMDDEVTSGDIYALENETTYTFGFEDSYCGQGENLSWEIALGGAQVLGFSTEKDLMLIQLSTAPPPEAGPYFLGWGSGAFTEVATIGHPCGGAKKIAIADPSAMEFHENLNRDVLKIEYWEIGAILGGASGGPLLDDEGLLLGLLSASDNDVCAGEQADSYFTAITTIIPFLGLVANSFNHHGPYDSNACIPIPDVELNAEKYGAGETVTISATQQVVLTSGFDAEAGSNVRVIIVPAASP